MALLTPMTAAEAKVLAAPFGLDVVGLSAITHGSVNSNFRLDLAGDGRAFLRVYEESGPATVRAQNALLTHLAASGVPTPTPMTNASGDSVASHAGRPVCLFPFCDGHWICQQRVDEAHAARVGEALARIHLAGEGYAGAPENRFASDALRARVAALESTPLDASLAADVALLSSRLDEVSALVDALAPTTVVHGDVFRDNVLWTDDGALSAVLDFESAAYGHPSFDLMVTMLAWCFGAALDRRLARALLAAYTACRPLSPDELGACHPQARAAAVRFAITRITDYELRPRGVVVHKDYRRFLARLCEVEAIGAAAFPEWLCG